MSLNPSPMSASNFASKRPLDLHHASNPEDQSLKTLLLAVMTDNQYHDEFSSPNLKNQNAPFGTLQPLIANQTAPISDMNTEGLLDGCSTPTSLSAKSAGLPLEILAAATATTCFDDCGQECPEGEECSQVDQCWDPDCSIDACGDTHPSTTACADPDCSIPAFASPPCDDPNCDQLFAAGLDVPCFDTQCLDGQSLTWEDHEPPQVCPPGNCYGFVDFNQQCLGTNTGLQPTTNTQHHCFHPMAVLHNQQYQGAQAYSFNGYQPFYYHCGNHSHVPGDGSHYHTSYQPFVFQGNTPFVQPPRLTTAAKLAESYTPTQDGRKRRRKSLTTRDATNQDRSVVRHGRSHSNACLDHAQLDSTLQAFRDAGYGLSVDDSYMPSLSPGINTSNIDPCSGIMTPSSISTTLGDVATPSSLGYLASPQMSITDPLAYQSSVRYQPIPYSLDQTHLNNTQYNHTSFSLPIIGNLAAPLTPSQLLKNLPCKWLIKDDDEDDNGKTHICGQLFANEKALHEHINEHHVPQRTNAYFCCWEGCPTLEKDYTHRTKLMRHIKGSHSKWHDFICTHIDPTTQSQCTRTFATKEQLDNHRNTHTGQKPFACSWPNCTHRSATKTQQTTHYRTHTGEKKYICPVCQHGTGDSSNLSKHIKNKHKDYLREKEMKGKKAGEVVAKVMAKDK